MSAHHDDHHRRDDHGGHGNGSDHHSHAGGRVWHRLRHLVTPHSHDSADQIDQAMRTSAEGIRALWISLTGLGITAVLQAVVVVFTGSVALLGDTVHNGADALTAVPLGLAFLVGRRAATRRYTYGFGRAEDLAGIAIVATVAVSAGLAGYQAVDRLLRPAPVGHLWAVALAGVVGFAGNEMVARYRIRVGRRIGSAALVADGLHARADGFTSLAVLASAGGMALGWRWADPVVGLVITAMIVIVLRDAAREVCRRLMDAVDPRLVETAERTLASTPGVHGVCAVRLRWIGHGLRAETTLTVDQALSLVDAHAIAVEAEHRLLHAVPRLTGAAVHIDPAGLNPDPHLPLAHHH